MKTICIIFILLPALIVAQNKNFRNSDDKRIVFEDDVVQIKTDTAYIISVSKKTASFRSY